MSDAPPVHALVVSRASRAWGAQLWLLGMAPALRQRGVELALCVPPDNPLADRWREAGFEMLPLVGPQAGSLRRPDGRRIGPIGFVVELAKTLAGVGRLIRLARRFDLLVSYSRHAHVEVALAGLLARRPVLVDVVDIVRPGLGQRALQLAARVGSAVVVNSTATAETLGTAPRTMHLVHPGVDIVRFSPGEADPAMREQLGDGGTPIIGVVGRLDPSKGIEIVADALARAAMSDVHPHLAKAHLAVVGDRGIAPEGFVEAMRARVEALLGDRVRFTGRIEDIPSVLRSLDVLVNASDAEPFGLSVLEAHAVGTPVVAASGGGIVDFVFDRTTGLRFRPGDVDDLADKLEIVLRDPDLVESMTAAAREQAVERFSDVSRYDLLASIYAATAHAGR